ncbi:Glycosyl hydrolase family 98 putative carbohydrate binding module [Emticicia oligotrophica DSM 17448]|uniref:Glycosyl hydrolase family 98 putative carbohydrate binding module n=1 Tax=Emticicia oligotrophica (strain DSM 17448 / CIP 109782 / MTCC 6937 / GPTSA100-15) TaxID=929562 RepID=A0ABM5N2I4_EMTOG|nr:NPCBM/NEW2 domain-containing protein [Emticicia oligotrophica]AFK03668.1 Glycosyl hydrolase family 98 putative carbohydrate binding module [Emticicia oligotrophica DSM 17448]
MIEALQRVLVLLLVTTLVSKAQVPSGFVDQLHSDGWQNPTGLTFDSNGNMYVWEKEGRIYVVENNNKTLFLDISEEVATYGDYGILGFVLDPNYINNGYIYLYYVVDRYYLFHYGEIDYDPSYSLEGATIARVTRYTNPNPDNPTTIDYGSRLILLGETKSTGIPITGTNHAGGGMAFGNDGTLLIGTGDGGLGINYDGDALADGIISESESLEDRVYRCQITNSLNGKVLRINPSNGDGVDGNPFFDSNAPRAAQSRVWALGFRNPFRLSVRPNSGFPGTVYVGEVGWNNREELNVISNGGLNFGWPIYEGNDRPTLWSNPTYVPGTYKKPTVEWIHDGSQEDISARVIINDTAHIIGSEEFPGNNFTGTCSIGGIWYTGTTFPEEYRNTYIFADFTPGWIKSFSFDNSNNPTSFRDLHTEVLGVVTLAYNPVDESIYYVKLGFNEGDPMEVRKISYVAGTNVKPTARFSFTPKYGASPLNVSFDASSSTDPENTSGLTYTWNFGDGQTSTGIDTNHIFDNGGTNPQAFTVKLLVTDEQGLVDSTSAIVSLNNTPPIIDSTSVDNISFFNNNGTDLLVLSAQASDNEEDASQLTYKWNVRLHHDEHSHPALDVTQQNTQLNLEIVPCDGHLYFYRVTLRVTDSYGLFTTYTKDIYPNCNPSDTTPPDEPLIKLYNVTDNSFYLAWDSVSDNAGISFYEVFINGVSKGILNAQTFTYQYTSQTSIFNQSFECYVKAIDLGGNATASTKLYFVAKNNSLEYLSDLTPISSTNGFGPVEIDKSNGEDVEGDGKTITLNGVTFSKGLGTHADAEIIYYLPSNQYSLFKTKIGIDDEVPNGNCGSVIFKIYRDNDLVYMSPIMTPTSATIDVSIDVSNANQLKLITDNAGDNIYCDHGDWADAKLIKVTDISDITPPSTPLNVAANAQIANNYQLSWSGSIDDTDTNLQYEILVNGVIIDSTTSLTYQLPAFNSGTYIVSVQAKDMANNRASSKSLALIYTPCESSLNLSEAIDYISTNGITLKAGDSINASNRIIGNSRVNYQATNNILLLPGFSVENGSTFKATIRGCDN